MAINQDIKALTVKDAYNPVYIWIVLKYLSHKLLQECSKVGTTVESIDFNLLKKMEIFIPEREQQDDFVKVWDYYDNVMQNLFLKKKLLLKLITGAFNVFALGETHDL
jgi:type I restriction enzyme S subunit